MNAELSITPATADDAGEIFTVQRAAYVTEGQRYGDVHLPPLTETLDELRAVLAADTVVLVARLGSRVVGSIRARVEQRSGHIGRLAVAPDLQGRGIGGRLLAQVEAACGPAVRRFELFTGARSEDNLRFYHRHGYVVRDHRPDDSGHLLAVLEKQLRAADPSTGGAG